jgi:hypothetical protein
MIKTVLLDRFGLTRISWSESNKKERRTIPHFTTLSSITKYWATKIPFEEGKDDASMPYTEKPLRRGATTIDPPHSGTENSSEKIMVSSLQDLLNSINY